VRVINFLVVKVFAFSLAVPVGVRGGEGVGGWVVGGLPENYL